MSYVQQAKVQCTLILRYGLCTASQGPMHPHLRYELCTASQGAMHPRPKI